MSADEVFEFLDDLTESIGNRISRFILGPEKYELRNKRKTEKRKQASEKAVAEFHKHADAFYDSVEEMKKKEAEDNLALAKKQQAYFKKRGLNVSFEGLTTFEEIMNKTFEAEKLLEEKWGLDEADDYDE